MLRTIILLLGTVVTVCSSAIAQDVCKQIKKEVTDENTSFSYETPYAEDAMPDIRAMRNYSTNPESEFDNFNIIFYIPCEFSDLIVNSADGDREREEMGVLIEFDDKTTLRADSVQITHDKKGDGTAARVAYMPVTEKNIGAFTTKKIVKFSLAKAPKDVAPELGTLVQQYMLCLKSVKKL